MELFTLIGLMLGLFGGTYTAIGALKGWFDPLIAEARKQSDVALQEVSNLVNQPQAQSTATKYHRWLNGACKTYHCAQAIPILCFGVFSFWIALWSDRHWGVLVDKDSASFWQSLLEWSYFIGLGCLGLAIVACLGVWGISGLIEHHRATAVEAVSQGITPIEG